MNKREKIVEVFNLHSEPRFVQYGDGGKYSEEVIWPDQFDAVADAIMEMDEAEARERHKKAIEYFNRPEAEFESDILQKTILIASGLTK